MGEGYWINWARWDGGHFMGIAENGYLPEQTVFFPGYPILIKLLMILGIPSLWGGLIISNVSLVLAMFFLFKIAELEFNEQIAKKTIIALLIFPTSFYLGVVYSESLFLLGAVGAFYFARTKKFLYAALFAGLAMSTRLVGIAVIAGVFTAYIHPFNLKKLFDRRIFFIFSSLLPLWIYIIYQNIIFGDTLGFLTGELLWERSLTWPWITLYNFFGNLNLSNFLEINSRHASGFELLFFCIGLTGLIYTYKKLHKTFLVYYLIAFLLPLFSGTLLAMPRYVLVLFPIYILVGGIRNKYLYSGILISSSILLIFYLIRFINNFWVS